MLDQPETTSDAMAGVCQPYLFADLFTKEARHLTRNETLTSQTFVYAARPIFISRRYQYSSPKQTIYVHSKSMAHIGRKKSSFSGTYFGRGGTYIF